MATTLSVVAVSQTRISVDDTLAKRATCRGYTGAGIGGFDGRNPWMRMSGN